MSKWIEGSVVSQKHWAGQLYSLQIEAELAPFQAGQFTKLALAVDGEMVGRPYSFVNAPGEPVYIFRDGIKDLRMRELLVDLLAVLLGHMARYAHDRRVRGRALQDDRIGTDIGIISHSNIA